MLKWFKQRSRRRKSQKSKRSDDEDSEHIYAEIIELPRQTNTEEGSRITNHSDGSDSEDHPCDDLVRCPVTDLTSLHHKLSSSTPVLSTGSDVIESSTQNGSYELDDGCPYMVVPIIRLGDKTEEFMTSFGCSMTSFASSLSRRHSIRSGSTETGSSSAELSYDSGTCQKSERKSQTSKYARTHRRRSVTRNTQSSTSSVGDSCFESDVKTSSDEDQTNEYFVSKMKENLQLKCILQETIKVRRVTDTNGKDEVLALPGGSCDDDKTNEHFSKMKEDFQLKYNLQESIKDTRDVSNDRVKHTSKHDLSLTTCDSMSRDVADSHELGRIPSGSSHVMEVDATKINQSGGMFSNSLTRCITDGKIPFSSGSCHATEIDTTKINESGGMFCNSLTRRITASRSPGRIPSSSGSAYTDVDASEIHQSGRTVSNSITQGVSDSLSPGRIYSSGSWDSVEGDASEIHQSGRIVSNSITCRSTASHKPGRIPSSSGSWDSVEGDASEIHQSGRIVSNSITRRSTASHKPGRIPSSSGSWDSVEGDVFGVLGKSAVDDGSLADQSDSDNSSDCYDSCQRNEQRVQYSSLSASSKSCNDVASQVRVNNMSLTSVKLNKDNRVTLKERSYSRSMTSSKLNDDCRITSQELSNNWDMMISESSHDNGNTSSKRSNGLSVTSSNADNDVSMPSLYDTPDMGRISFSVNSVSDESCSSHFNPTRKLERSKIKTVCIPRMFDTSIQSKSAFRPVHSNGFPDGFKSRTLSYKRNNSICNNFSANGNMKTAETDPRSAKFSQIKQRSRSMDNLHILNSATYKESPRGSTPGIHRKFLQLSLAPSSCAFEHIDRKVSDFFVETSVQLQEKGRSEVYSLPNFVPTGSLKKIPDVPRSRDFCSADIYRSPGRNNRLLSDLIMSNYRQRQFVVR